MRLVKRITEDVKRAGGCDPAAKEIETVAKDERGRLEKRRSRHNFAEPVHLEARPLVNGVIFFQQGSTHIIGVTQGPARVNR